MHLYSTYFQNHQANRSFQPSYSNHSILEFKPIQEQSESRTKSISLSSTRSKGLSLSLRKDTFGKKSTNQSSSIMNPEYLKQSGISRVKNESTLVKTTHTIHNLGRSLSKSKDQRNKSASINRQKLLKQSNSPNVKCKNGQISYNESFQKSEKSIFNTIKQKEYHIKIREPKETNFVENSNISLRNSQNKLAELKTKSFLRSSKNQNFQSQNNCINNAKNRIHNKPSLLKTSSKNIEIKSKRQFLESFIDKPMINSIIVSGQIDHFQQQPQSPVLRLKKRLQLNSINCIYQKETLISHQVQENQHSKIEIQQSIIVHRNISQNFKPLTHQINIFSQGQQSHYKLYLGQQIHSNLIFTMKEFPFDQFKNFTRQIRNYQEIDVNNLKIMNILQLIKYSADSDRHLIIKQPYTQTLYDYFQSMITKFISQEQLSLMINSIVKIIKQTVLEFEKKNMFLKRRLSINDFVFVFQHLKFENLEMFQIGIKGKREKEQIIDDFQRQVQIYLSRISSGSLNFSYIRS